MSSLIVCLRELYERGPLKHEDFFEATVDPSWTLQKLKRAGAVESPGIHGRIPGGLPWRITQLGRELVENRRQRRMLNRGFPPTWMSPLPYPEEHVMSMSARPCNINLEHVEWD